MMMMLVAMCVLVIGWHLSISARQCALVEGMCVVLRREGVLAKAARTKAHFVFTLHPKLVHCHLFATVHVQQTCEMPGPKGSHSQ